MNTTRTNAAVPSDPERAGGRRMASPGIHVGMSLVAAPALLSLCAVAYGILATFFLLSLFLIGVVLGADIFMVHGWFGTYVVGMAVGAPWCGAWGVVLELLARKARTGRYLVLSAVLAFWHMLAICIVTVTAFSFEDGMLSLAVPLGFLSFSVLLAVTHIACIWATIRRGRTASCLTPEEVEGPPSGTEGATTV